MNSRFPSCPSLWFPVQYAAAPVTHTENERGALTVSSPLQTLSPLSASSFYSLTLTRSGEIFIYLFLTGSLSCMRACVCVCVDALFTLSEAGTFELHNVCASAHSQPNSRDMMSWKCHVTRGIYSAFIMLCMCICISQTASRVSNVCECVPQLLCVQGKIPWALIFAPASALSHILRFSW